MPTAGDETPQPPASVRIRAQRVQSGLFGQATPVTLGRCARCRGIGLREDLLRIERALFHGACAWVRFGRVGLLKLPPMERDKLRLTDVGPSFMRELIAITTCEAPPKGSRRPNAACDPLSRDERPMLKGEQWTDVGGIIVRTGNPLVAIQVAARVSPTRERGRTREGVEWMTPQAFQRAQNRHLTPSRRQK